MVVTEQPGDLRISDAEAARLTAAWNDGAHGPLTFDTALYALHIANDALGWNTPVAKMIVETALRRSLAATRPVPASGEPTPAQTLQDVSALARLWSEQNNVYPPTPEGQAAAAAVRCCVRELNALLAGETWVFDDDVHHPVDAAPAAPGDGALPLGHEFLPVRLHPDDDECTHRSDGTDATYCGLPAAAHEAGDGALPPRGDA